MGKGEGGRGRVRGEGEARGGKGRGDWWPKGVKPRRLYNENSCSESPFECRRPKINLISIQHNNQ